ncbi:DUF1203 domain-containing protein [Sphingomonas sp. CBMAI 2297]|uniref:DUF1203 domain-containing protein n=1 Tax=Sphingomonas sp. CBMAI 2297 TaxID=2991720 RepID=UPI002456B278|nr:DUF1203 domain-containing protein [Sphingomonas sp. CBMAI 2297]MDH4744792.1 DUF1203 domain-containing protein [Sphingomonas sp. CBMAI 2297]
MNYVIQGIDPAPFRSLYGLSDAELAARHAVRMRVAKKPGAPCRVTLADAEPGETVLLVNHEHLPVASPYRSAHAIFVREGAEVPARFENAVPEPLAIRLLSVRAFDAAGMMTDAEVVEGRDLEPLIARFFADPAVAYLHVHNARPGCFAARVDRG